MDYTDRLLELEEQYYKEGFKEGQSESLHNSFLEGKQFGLQVGFQRFVLINQIIGICDIIDSLNLQNDLLNRNISVIRHLVNSIQMNNDDENVENLDKVLVKLKNKFRTVLLSFQRLRKDTPDNRQLSNHLTFNSVEDLSSVIAGKIIGFVEDEEVTEAKVKQDQLHEW